jgi:hypothetical protein
MRRLQICQMRLVKPSQELHYYTTNKRKIFELEWKKVNRFEKNKYRLLNYVHPFKRK